MQSLDEIGNNGGNLSPTQKKDMKNLILANSKNLLVKVLSPAKDKNSTNNYIQQQQSKSAISTPTAQTNTTNHSTAAVTTTNTINNGTNETKDRPVLMTRRELTDPFGSDDEEDSGNNKRDSQSSVVTANDVNNGDKTTTPSIDPSTTNVSLTTLIEFSFGFTPSSKIQHNIFLNCYHLELGFVVLLQNFIKFQIYSVSASNIS